MRCGFSCARTAGGVCCDVTSMRRALGLLALLASVALVVATLAPPERSLRGKHAPPLLPRAWLLKIAGRAFIPLISDYYWLQTIQATGKAQTVDEYRDGERMPLTEVVNMVNQLLIAGHETTTALITNCVWRLLEDRAAEFGAELIRVVDGAVSRILRARALSTR